MNFSLLASDLHHVTVTSRSITVEKKDLNFVIQFWKFFNKIHGNFRSWKLVKKLNVVNTMFPRTYSKFIKPTRTGSRKCTKCWKHFNWFNLIIQIKSSVNFYRVELLHFWTTTTIRWNWWRKSTWVMENEWISVFKTVRWFKMQICNDVYVPRFWWCLQMVWDLHHLEN